MKKSTLLFVLISCMFGCSAASGPSIASHVRVQNQALDDCSPATVLGEKYHDDFDAEHGVTCSGSPCRVSAWANQASDGDAYPVPIDTVHGWPNPAGWPFHGSSSDEWKPVYSATSFNGNPGVAPDAYQEPLRAFLSDHIAGRAYMWVAFTNSVVGETDEHLTSLHSQISIEDDLYDPSLSTLDTSLAYGHVYHAWRYGEDGDDEAMGCSSGGSVVDFSYCDPSSTQPDSGGTHLLEIGYTTDGTGTFVVDGNSFDDINGVVGGTGYDITQLDLFGTQQGIEGARATIARVIVAKGLPSSEQLGTMRSCLADKYGVTLP